MMTQQLKNISYVYNILLSSYRGSETRLYLQKNDDARDIYYPAEYVKRAGQPVQRFLVNYTVQRSEYRRDRGFDEREYRQHLT